MSASLCGAENILNEVFDEWNRSSTALSVEEEVLCYHCVVFASCTRSSQVVDSWMSGCKL